MAGDDQLNGGAHSDYCYGGTGTNAFTACEVYPAGTGPSDTVAPASLAVSAFTPAPTLKAPRP